MSVQQNDTSRFRIVRNINPYTALGYAVSYLMNKPSFAKQPFGQWSQILTGQINRKHYAFVFEENRVIAFAGWGRTTRDKAERWLNEGLELSSQDSRHGECVVINAIATDHPKLIRFLLRDLSDEIRGCSELYGIRFYEDGRLRRLRLPIERLR